MANFFAGQMVRVIKVYTAKEALGKEARLIRWHESGCWEAAVDGYGEWSNGLWYGFDEDQIEPILPEGAQPSEFSFTELMDNLGVVVA